MMFWQPSVPEQVLADRFARNEIDEQHYHQRLNGCGITRGRWRGPRNRREEQ